jgi:hypothetical protein
MSTPRCSQVEDDEAVLALPSGGRLAAEYLEVILTLGLCLKCMQGRPFPVFTVTAIGIRRCQVCTLLGNAASDMHAAWQEIILELIPCVGHAMVLGSNHPFLVCLLSLKLNPDSEGLLLGEEALQLARK